MMEFDKLPEYPVQRAAFSQPLFDALTLANQWTVSGVSDPSPWGDSLDRVQLRAHRAVRHLRPRLMWTIRTLLPGEATVTEDNLVVVRASMSLIRDALRGGYSRSWKLMVDQEMDEVHRWCSLMASSADGPLSRSIRP